VRFFFSIALIIGQNGAALIYRLYPKWNYTFKVWYKGRWRHIWTFKSEHSQN